MSEKEFRAVSDQTEYVCPQCRRKTVVNVSEESEAVFCPRCEIEMKVNVKTSEIAAAAANAPSSSGGVKAATSPKTKRASSKTTTTKAAGTKATKTTKTTKSKAAEAEAPAPTQPDFGEFRCACCGHVKHVALGTEKPASGWRCPSCFVKLDWVRS